MTAPLIDLDPPERPEWTATVNGRELYQALTAVTPHMGDETSRLERLLVEFRDDPHEQGEKVLLLTASNQHTIAHAVVPVGSWDEDGAWFGRALLTPADVKALTAEASATTKGLGTPLDITLTCPAGMRVEFPAAAYRISAAHAPGRLAPREQAEAEVPTILQARLLTLFAKAAAAYHEPLVVWPHEQPRTGPVTITVGSQFLGLLMPMRGGGPDSTMTPWGTLLDAAAEEWSS